MRASLRRAYVVGEPESTSVFQLNYYVDVAVIDDAERELPGVLTFIFGVVSPRWIENNLESSEIMVGRHYIIAKTCDLDLIDAKLKDYIESFEASTPTALLQKLEKIGRSDSEDGYPLPERPFL